VGTFQIVGNEFAVWALPDLFTHTNNSLTLAEAHQIIQHSVSAKANVLAHSAITNSTDNTSATSKKSRKNPKDTIIQNGKLACSGCLPKLNPVSLGGPNRIKPALNG
jgi:hypothetical protein